MSYFNGPFIVGKQMRQIWSADRKLVCELPVFMENAEAHANFILDALNESLGFKKCHICEGKGFFYGETKCIKCNGSGFITKDKKSESGNNDSSSKSAV